MPAKRRDIQGLRAVAVVAVVVNHLTGHLVGGFVGVDMFFVISGYLITGILLRDLGAGLGPAGYLVAFYKRRVRRILPAAVVVIALTLVAAHQVFSTNRFATTRVDGWWSLVFWANWHFIDIDTNYFTAGGPVSPFQHYWSLAVEEQFYVVWPVLIFVVALAARRLSRRVSVGAAALVLTGVSLAIAAAQSSTEPTTAYFSSFTRGWELGLGAFLACLPALRAPRRVLTLLSWAGTALVGIALFVARASVGFPFPGALVPCLGAAIVIVAGPGARIPVLTNWLAVRIGDISYSVYLVHFPVIVLLGVAMSDHGAYFFTAVPLLTLGLACALYGLVERPILTSNWLQPKRLARDRAAAADEPVGTKRWVVAAAVAVVTGLVAIAMQPDQSAAIRRQYQAVNAPAKRPPAALPLKLATLQKQIATALRATHYPGLHPTMTAATSGNFASAAIIACGQSSLPPIGSCTIGPPNAAHTLYIAGDSTSAVYAEAFTSIVETMPHWRLVIRSGFGCPFSAGEYQEVEGTESGCASHNDTVVREIQQLRPDVLVVTDEYRRQTPLGASTPLSARAQIADVNRELAQVRSSVGSVVRLAPPPGGADLADCYRPDSAPVQCVARPSSTWTGLAAADNAAARVAHETFVDPRSWFCSPAGYCPSFVGDVPTMYDGTHATQAYMDKIAPVLRDALQRARVLP